MSKKASKQFISGENSQGESPFLPCRRSVSAALNPKIQSNVNYGSFGIFLFAVIASDPGDTDNSPKKKVSPPLTCGRPGCPEDFDENNQCSCIRVLHVDPMMNEELHQMIKKHHRP